MNNDHIHNSRWHIPKIHENLCTTEIDKTTASTLTYKLEKQNR